MAGFRYLIIMDPELIITGTNDREVALRGVADSYNTVVDTQLGTILYLDHEDRMHEEEILETVTD